ncbi:MAG: SUMF1/EgtB/PvdO family nonheme iron enzyme [Nitrospinae bacterium]|nr:SUMF1/EgtB/PvdO family nonheme iron enzyme [Nitrospinota bacterium]MBL7019036.1 SUMF1/EgtB/PvdO family nonheme iron enzyme [Nitrospinaceae bacterium]
MKNATSIIILIVLLFSPHSLFAVEMPSDMVQIKAGCFLMGTNDSYIYEDDEDNAREKPAHKVCLSAFHLDRYEVTQRKWDAVMNINRSVFHRPEQPITHIDWNEAHQYCKSVGKRLPTEAEWEYAARAGKQTRFSWGNEIDDDYLWYAGNSSREPADVGKKKPNAWGLYDMVGGVWEWVGDWFSPNYYEQSPTKNPKGPTQKSFRVIRGNSWMSEEQHLRVMARQPGMSDQTLSYWVGVRCALSP